MIGAQVELNNAEQRLARFMARSRMDNAIKRGITNAQVGSQDRFDIDLEGYGAELAFCKLFNVYPDMSIVADPSADRTGDAIWMGKTVDVKTTKYKTGRLLAVRWKQKKDLYALMVGTFPKYEFRGMATGDKLIRQENLTDLGHGEGYALGQHQLKGANNVN